MKKYLRLPSPAMAVALLALFTALSASAYAATVITGKNVRNSSLTGADIQSKSIAGTDIKDGALAARDIKAGSLTADRFSGGQLAVKPRWVFVNSTGQISAQSGGFTVKSGFQANPAGAAGNVYIDSGEDLSNNAIVASSGLQNARDANGDAIMSGRAPGADNNPEFSGEISAIQCAITGVVTCAPPGTNTNTHFVVSPRNSDGTVTTGADRKPFYVIITG